MLSLDNPNVTTLPSGVDLAAALTRASTQFCGSPEIENIHTIATKMVDNYAYKLAPGRDNSENIENRLAITMMLASLYHSMDWSDYETKKMAQIAAKVRAEMSTKQRNAVGLVLLRHTWCLFAYEVSVQRTLDQILIGNGVLTKHYSIDNLNINQMPRGSSFVDFITTAPGNFVISPSDLSHDLKYHTIQTRFFKDENPCRWQLKSKIAISPSRYVKMAIEYSLDDLQGHMKDMTVKEGIELIDKHISEAMRGNKYYVQ